MASDGRARRTEIMCGSGRQPGFQTSWPGATRPSCVVPGASPPLQHGGEEPVRAVARRREREVIACIGQQCVGPWVWSRDKRDQGEVGVASEECVHLVLVLL